MNKKIKHYNTGGQLAGALASGATSFIPGVGPMIAPIAGSLISSAFKQEQRKPKKVSSGYMAKGGRLPTAALPIGPDAVKYQGPKHSQGGIPVDNEGNPTSKNTASAEVEGEETRQGDYIFSDQLKVPGKDVTFAQMHELLLQQNASKQQIDKLAQMQESAKSKSNETTRVPATKMKYGGDLKKYEEGGGLGAGALLQRFAPSVTKLATAAFAPRPQKTRQMTQTKIEPETGLFKDARRNLAAGMRANPSQGAYAQYTKGVNQLTAQEASYRNKVDTQNAQNKMRTDQFNIQNEARDADARSRDIAGRIGLVDKAIQQPLTAAQMDKRGREQQVAALITSADKIGDPVERDRAIFRRLKAIGLPDEEALSYVSNPDNIQ